MFSSLFQLEQKPVTVFRSTDASAPVLTAEAGSLKSLLKACLVTGYGDKTALGWQMLFESDDQLSAVFKSTDPTASGYCLKVDNSAVNPQLSVYQSMSDIDTGTRPTVENREWIGRAADWTLIGHGKTFVFLVDTVIGGARQGYPILFGELPRETKRLAPVCVFWSGRYGRSNGGSGSVQSTLFYYVGGRYVDGTTNSIRAMDCYPFIYSAGTAGKNLTQNDCQFRYNSARSGAPLYAPVLSLLDDGTWTFLPMLQPLSNRQDSASHLGLINETAIKASIGRPQSGAGNTAVAIPTNFWWA